MNNNTDTSESNCPACRAKAAKRRLVQSQRALSHLEQQELSLEQKP